MVGKKQRAKRQAGLLGNHQKCWLWGRHAVLESLRAGRWLPLELAYDSRMSADAVTEVQSLAQSRRIAIQPVEASQLARICGAKDHQGLVARMPVYPYVPLDEVLGSLPRQAFILLLNGIQDPFNFGSILRSADLFGVDAVIVPTAGQVDVSSHVARASVGAVNYLSIAQADSLVATCERLKSLGLKIVAATEKGQLAPADARMTTGLALIIGNEGVGVSPALLAECDEQLCIPQQGHVGSLNAAVAAGILCYEVQRQRLAMPDGRSRR
ncbi:23S rRNA (guanosine(2251)-2'-O)-methyltransferase RlmB [Planctomicrobium sp. SH664]|uniref:23S rRNA (guanosine(2251)-2'-O)-methyltransferase RlmB n=1 Tax=Planctomicrobium sp. SH664 TaxID=3448125 RepID=UPI003F5B1B4A